MTFSTNLFRLTVDMKRSLVRALIF